jgi:hypothetical protein
MMIVLSGTPPPPPIITIVPPYKLKVGFNLPYYNCGFDFGPDPGDYKKQDPDWLTKLGPDLATLKSAGVDVVRWFLLANGYNYGFRPDYHASFTPKPFTPEQPAPGYIPPPKSDEVWWPSQPWWSFDPPNPPDPRFVQHFQIALEIFRASNMQFIPSLIHHTFFWAGRHFVFGPVKASPDEHDFSYSGRYDIANDSDKRKIFLETLLDPLLTVSEPYWDVIYAWEVMNEPTYANSILMPESGYVTEATLTSFLTEAIDLITKHGLPSTVGHRWFSDLKKYPTGSKPQIHFYATLLDPFLPLTPLAFLGEFGSKDQSQGSGGAFDADQSKRWPEMLGDDEDPDTFLQARLQQLEQLKYELALVWPDLGVPGSNGLLLSPHKLDQIRKFTSGERI